MAYEALYTRGRPKNLSQLVGQEHISAALSRAISNNRLSHAYLLVGTRGTGKTSTARLLSKAMNCERVLESQQSGQPLSAKDIPCNKCDSCLTIDSSPDNVEFDAASNRSVDDVTRLLSTAYMSPIQSRIKTFIIDEVHMLSFEAVNSILKLIEEPPPNVAFFLATTELNKVPMTIRSRCQVLNFRLIPQDIIAPYLIKLANRLDVELQADASRKIARLAEGSMRDAITYLDQCYAMADKTITLDDVNRTLGLISDSDLDEIISAVKSKNRRAVAEAIAHAYSTGLSSILIAESLITRLRDIEFRILDAINNEELRVLDHMVNELREAVLEMQGSGIPDIILEMALMKLSAPTPVIIQMPAVVGPATRIENTPPPRFILNGDFGKDKKIFYEIFDELKDVNANAFACMNNSIVLSFDNDILTIGVPSGMMMGLFNEGHKIIQTFISEAIGRPIQVAAVIRNDLPNPKNDRLEAIGLTSLVRAMKIFNAANYTEIDD